MTEQRYKIKTGVSSELLSLSEAKSHLRIGNSDYDTYVGSLIPVARKAVENFTNLLIGEQTWNLYQDVLKFQTTISKVPVNSIESFSYLNQDNELKTMANHTTVYEDLKSKPARIAVEDVPDLFDEGYNQIIIEFKAGITDLPETLKQAMLLMIGHWFENRQDVVTGTQVNEIPETSKYLMLPYIHYEFR